MHKVIHALLVISILCTSCSKTEYDIGIIAGTVIDGTGRVDRDRLIMINNDCIAGIEDFGDIQRYHFKQIIDARDKYVIPGLFDMHTHITMNLDTIVWENGSQKRYYTPRREEAEWALKSMLYFGVTTIRELGGFPEMDIALRNDINHGKIQGPTLFACTHLVNDEPMIFGSTAVKFTSEEEARKYVREQKNAGVDLVKLLFNVPPGIAKAVIDEAHKQNLKVAGHMGKTSWKEALEFGVDDLVHPPYDDPNFTDLKSEYAGSVIKTMKEKKIPNHTTLNISYNHAFNMELAKLLIPEDIFNSVPSRVRNIWEWRLGIWKKQNPIIDSRAIEFELAYTKKAYEEGIILMTGTDFGGFFIIPGYGLHREMELMAQAGIPNSEIIKMATFNGARHLGIHNEKGTIEKGKVADLLILMSDPVDDIRNTQSIISVMKNGKLVDREKLWNEMQEK